MIKSKHFRVESTVMFQPLICPCSTCPLISYCNFQYSYFRIYFSMVLSIVFSPFCSKFILLSIVLFQSFHPEVSVLFIQRIFPTIIYASILLKNISPAEHFLFASASLLYIARIALSLQRHLLFFSLVSLFLKKNLCRITSCTSHQCLPITQPFSSNHNQSATDCYAYFFYSEFFLR